MEKNHRVESCGDEVNQVPRESTTMRTAAMALLLPVCAALRVGSTPPSSTAIESRAVDRRSALAPLVAAPTLLAAALPACAKSLGEKRYGSGQYQSVDEPTEARRERAATTARAFEPA